MVTTITATTATWFPTTHEDYDALTGRDVFSFDGEKLGTVDAVFHPQDTMPEARGSHWFLVTPGGLKRWFGGGEAFYVPEAAIADVTADGLTLVHPADRLEAQGWDRAPAGIERYRRA